MTSTVCLLFSVKIVAYQLCSVIIHFSGSSRAVGPVSVCVWTVTSELNNLWPRHSACWFILNLDSVSGHRLKLWLWQENVAKMVGVTFSEGFLVFVCIHLGSSQGEISKISTHYWRLLPLLLLLRYFIYPAFLHVYLFWMRIDGISKMGFVGQVSCYPSVSTNALNGTQNTNPNHPFFIHSSLEQFKRLLKTLRFV